MTTALITGIAGQDGAYLTRLLQERDYRVVGMVEPGLPVRPDVAPYLSGVKLVPGTMLDIDSLRSVVTDCDPDEVYNLAGVSSVARSWVEPGLTADVNGTGFVRLVRALVEQRDHTGHAARLLQASSSEMF